MTTAPTRIGRYDVLRVLAQGGMGDLYLARDPELGREVVVKGMRPELSADPGSRERFLREARTLGGLDHPNIVPVFDLVEHEGRWFIVMPRVDGESLRDRLGDGPLGYHSVLRVASGLASALDSAHRAGIVHRDVKPENVIVSAGGDAKLLDFGIAWRQADASLTGTNMSVGTLLATAPEQFSGELPGPGSDLFAFGSLLYETVCGAHPFAGTTAPEVAYRIVNTVPTPPQQSRSDLPVELVHMLSKCLEKDPKLRYQSAAEVLADLRRLERELTGGAPDIAPLAVAGSSRRTASLAGDEVPKTLPLPSVRARLAWVAAGVLTVAMLLLVRPEPYPTAENTRATAAGAEAASRRLLERMGQGLYRFNSATTIQRNGMLDDFIALRGLSGAERGQLTEWRHPRSHRTTLVSPDYVETFTVEWSDGGRLASFVRKLRPEFDAPAITPDSSARLAQAYLRAELGRDPSALQPLPMTETERDRRVEREFVWLGRDSLPGGARGRVAVGLAGAHVITASSALDLPPLATRVIKDQDQASLPVVAVTIVICVAALILILLLARSQLRWPATPAFAGFVAAFTLFMLVATGPETLEQSIPQGVVPWNVLLSLLSFAVFGSVLLVMFVAGVAALRTWAPRLLAGMDRIEQLRVAPQAIARAIVVGLPAGALAIWSNRFVPVVLDRVGWAQFSPSTKIANPPLVELAGTLPGAVLAGSVALFGLGALALVRRRTALAGWAWPLGAAAVAAGFAASSVISGVLLPWSAAWLVTMLFAAILMWPTLRYGALCLLAAQISIALTGVAITLSSVATPDTRGAAIAVTLLWCGLLAWAWWRLGEPRPALVPDVATQSVPAR